MDLASWMKLYGIVKIYFVSILFCHPPESWVKGSHIRQDSMEPSDLWDDVSNCQCGDRLKTLEQRVRKQHQRCLAHSLVGTPNYIAPEVLLRKGACLQPVTGQLPARGHQTASPWGQVATQSLSRPSLQDCHHHLGILYP